MPEQVVVDRKSIFDLSLFDLLAAYGQHLARQERQLYTIEPFMLHSVETAIERLSQMTTRNAG